MRRQMELLRLRSARRLYGNIAALVVLKANTSKEKHRTWLAQDLYFPRASLLALLSRRGDFVRDDDVAIVIAPGS